MDHERPDEQLGAWLRSARPTPDPLWRQATEERLFARRGLRLPSLPVLRVAGGLAGGFAAVLAALTLAGTGPLSGNDGARAKERCRTVSVTRTERRPSIRVARDGTPVVVQRERPVQRFVRRCS